MSIKESFEKTTKLYHFTSFDTALKIIESNRLRFGRLSNMNDIHENAKNFFVGNNSSTKSFPTDVLNVLCDEILKYRQISLTTKRNCKEGFDLHQMWGIYADKGEGVCLVFDKKELEKNPDIANIYPGCVKYDGTQKLDSCITSYSEYAEEVVAEIRKNVKNIFFHKRKEWEHEQEYRLIKRCPNPLKEEYLLLGDALKFVILSSKSRNTDEVRYFARLEKIKAVLNNRKGIGNRDAKCQINILIYGNGIFDYALSSEDGKEAIWDSQDGYNVLNPGSNCELLML